jgi:type VI secretion system protein ImpK
MLSLAIVLRRSRDLDGFADLRPTVDRLFHEFRSSARDLGIAEVEISEASYALAAFIDEILLSGSWGGREAWQRNCLAKQYCNDEFVGDGFYDKLAEVRRSAAPKHDVVEVFYYCLISGFQGRLVESVAQRDALIDELAREVGTELKVLAPHGLPVPEGGKLQPIRRFPWPIVVVASVLVPIVVWLVSWDSLERHAEKVARALGGS